tara:strand:+ start:127 stop:564 length:438 start_codon:yes stop_codon:yes gene_type:complete
MRLYHYTQERYLESILGDGFLKLGRPVSSIPNVIWLTSEKFVPNICRPQDHSVSPPRFSDVKFHRFLFDSKDPSIRRWSLFRRKIKGVRGDVMALEQKALDLKDNPRKWYVAEIPLQVATHENAETDPDYNFFVEGSGAINFFAP